MKSDLRVVTSCRSRFHIFEQASQLERKGFLHKLISDYPESYPVKFGVPSKKIQALVALGVITHGASRIGQFLPRQLRSILDRYTNKLASWSIANKIPRDIELFIGMSSFCLESINVCEKLGIDSVVDHGSLHLVDELKFQLAEASRWGVNPKVAIDIPDWMIEKEQEEFERAKIVFCVSDRAYMSLVKNGVSSQKIFANHLGVDLSRFTVSEEKKITDEFHVLQAGGVVLRKGVLSLLHAFKKLRGRGHFLHFAGGGLETSGIKKHVEKLSGDNVIYHGALNFAHLLDLYRSSDVCVLASVADGFGMVVPQAMSCGKPVIVTENVGARSLIRDGVNGFVVKPGDAQELSERLQLLRDDRQLREEMGAAALETVRSGFTWNDYGDRLAQYLVLR